MVDLEKSESVGEGDMTGDILCGPEPGGQGCHPLFSAAFSAGSR